MNLLVLSSILIIILCLAVYAMTRQQAIESEIKQLVQQANIEQLYHDYKSNHRTLNLYVLGGILLTGGFALTFFSGGELNPSQWQLEQFVYALVGLVATVSITLGQRSLYRSIRQNISALLVTLLVLAFVIFSEVATTSEREASLVRDRSLDSPTLQALLQQIATPNPSHGYHSTLHYYRQHIMQAEQALSHCDTAACRTTQQAKLAQYQQQLQATQQDIQSQYENQRQDKLLYTQQAQKMEYNEQNHSAVIRWLQEHFSATFTAAMMFASLIFVVAFESGFHFTGTKEGIYLESLARLGYSVSSKESLPRSTMKPKKSVPDTQGTADNTEQIQQMQQRYEKSKAAKTSESVHCPNCNQMFVKTTHNKAFCQSRCKDDYWNTVKPERLKTMRGAG